MAYEYKDVIKEELEYTDLNNADSQVEMLKELDEVYRKAKVFDEIEQSYWESNTPENFAYEFVRIFENRFSSDKERADDER